MKNKHILLLLFYKLLIINWAVPLEDISLSGYYKSFFTVLKPPDYIMSGETNSTAPMGAVQNKLRLQLFMPLSDWLSFSGAYEIVPTIQDHELFHEDIYFADIQLPGYRVWDIDPRLYPPQGESVNSFAFFHNLDRLLFTIKLSFADIFLGRQAIAWGSARVINPTDVIAPFAFKDLDSEERRGVDALRIRIPLGLLDELDFGYLAGEELSWEKSAFFARSKFNLWNTDISLLVLGFRQNLLLGFDMSGSLGGAGLWMEAAYVIPEIFKPGEEWGEGQGYVRISTGLDYNFNSGLYGFMEYHYNSAGSLNSEDYLENLNSPAYQDGSVYLLGIHYLSLGLTYQMHPLIPLHTLIIWNLCDFSLMWSLSVEYNIAENIYIKAGVFLGLGGNPEQIMVGPGLTVLKPYSEFGTYPDMFYTSFRLYF
jgi:hypothetical protein